MKLLQLKTVFAFLLLLSIFIDVNRAQQSIAGEEEADADNEDEDAYVLKSNAPAPAAVIDDDDNAEKDDGNDDSSEPSTDGCSASYVLDHMFLQEKDDDNLLSDLSANYELHTLKEPHQQSSISFDRYYRLTNFTTNLKTQWTPFAREFASHFSDLLYEAQLEPACMGALLKLTSGIADRKPWALSFVDATGNYLLNGYLSGRLTSLGDYDQCLEISTSKNNEDLIDGKPIQGQYCLVKPQIPLPNSVNSSEPMVKSILFSEYFSPDYIDSALELYRLAGSTVFRFGLCLPVQCAPEDVEEAINRVLVRKSGFSVAVANCARADDKIKLDKYQLAAVIAFGVLASLVIASTFYELLCITFTDILYYPPSAQRPVRQLVTAFSLLRNVSALFNKPSSERKQSLDTLRLLTILFYFVVNSYADAVLFAPAALQRLNVLGPQMLSSKSYAFLRTHYMMDIFHVISGISFVLYYNRKSSQFSYFSYIARAYVLYILPILGSVAIIYVVPLLGSGPLWHLFEQTFAKPCKRFAGLASTLSLTSNHEVDFKNTCHFPSTFVGLTFQMLLMAPLFTAIANRFKSPKVGVVYLFATYVLFTLAHLLARFWYTIKVPWEYQTMTGGFSELKHSAIFYGLSPLSHISSLVFGLAVGHFLTRLPPAKPLTAVIVGVATFLLHAFGFYLIEGINLRNPEMREKGAAAVLTLSRASYLPFYSWLAYVAIGGQFDLISRFLSASVWVPFSRLSYGFFLSYLTVILWRLFSAREPVTLSPDVMFIAIISDVVISFLLSFCLYAIVQQPFQNIEQAISKRKTFSVLKQKIEKEKCKNKKSTKLEKGRKEDNNVVQRTQL